MTASSSRTSRLLHMDGVAWKGPVKDRAAADGLDRARVVEALLEAYAGGRISVTAPTESTYGQKTREQCRAKIADSAWDEAERRWQPAREGGRSMSLLCELLLAEYAAGRILLTVTAKKAPARRS